MIVHKMTIIKITTATANKLGWQKNRNVNNNAIKLILIPPIFNYFAAKLDVACPKSWDKLQLFFEKTDFFVIFCCFEAPKDSFGDKYA